MQAVVQLAIVLLILGYSQAVSTVVYKTQLVSEAVTTQIVVTFCEDHGCSPTPITHTKVVTASPTTQTPILLCSKNTSYISNTSTVPLLPSSSTAPHCSSCAENENASSTQRFTSSTNPWHSLNTSPITSAPAETSLGEAWSSLSSTRWVSEIRSTVPAEAQTQSSSAANADITEAKTVVKKTTISKTLTVSDKSGVTSTILVTSTLELPPTFSSDSSAIVTQRSQTTEAFQSERETNPAVTLTKETTIAKRTTIVKTLTTCNEEGVTQTVVVTSTLVPTPSVTSSVQWAGQGTTVTTTHSPAQMTIEDLTSASISASLPRVKSFTAPLSTETRTTEPHSSVAQSISSGSTTLSSEDSSPPPTFDQTLASSLSNTATVTTGYAQIGISSITSETPAMDFTPSSPISSESTNSPSIPTMSSSLIPAASSSAMEYKSIETASTSQKIYAKGSSSSPGFSSATYHTLPAESVQSGRSSLSSSVEDKPSTEATLTSPIAHSKTSLPLQPTGDTRPAPNSATDYINSELTSPAVSSTLTSEVGEGTIRTLSPSSRSIPTAEESSEVLETHSSAALQTCIPDVGGMGCISQTNFGTSISPSRWRIVFQPVISIVLLWWLTP